MKRFGGMIVAGLFIGSAACGSGSINFAESDASVQNSEDSGASQVCATGKVTFALTMNGSYCIGSCGRFMTITDANGAAIGLDNTCSTNCETCQPLGCPAGCVGPMPATNPQTAAWDGSYYAAKTCGASTACAEAACAPAGHYTAHFCYSANTADAGASCQLAQQPQTCADVPFDWPSTTTISATVGP